MKTSQRNRHRLPTRRNARCDVINPYQYDDDDASFARRAFPSQQCFKMKKMERKMLLASGDEGLEGGREGAVCTELG